MNSRTSPTQPGREGPSGGDPHVSRNPGGPPHGCPPACGEAAVSLSFRAFPSLPGALGWTVSRRVVWLGARFGGQMEKGTLLGTVRAPLGSGTR